MNEKLSKKTVILLIGLSVFAFILIVAAGWYFLNDDISSAVEKINS